MGEEGAGIGRGDGINGRANGGDQRVEGSGLEPTQDRLDLGEGLLDGCEVGRVR